MSDEGQGNPFEEAQAKVDELLANAKSGAIIPIRLPGQIEEIQKLLKKAKTKHEDEVREAKATAAVSGDFDVAEEAYFVGHAVHELRNPMTSIRGYSDMLANMGELSDMQKQFMDVIKTNVHRMEGLLTDVSYINKIRKNTLKVQAKMDIFKNLAQRIEKEVKPLAEQLSKTFEMDIPQGLPMLQVDGDLLTVAVKKLVENGLRYSGEDGKVTLSAEDGGDNKLIIYIKDNGIGINADDQSHLGEMYFRGENDKVREFKGSGLGIPIAYGILDLIGADYKVETKEGDGTTFTITLEGMGV